MATKTKDIVIKGKNKTHKLCLRCGKIKPISEFYRNTYKYDGLQPPCKKCHQEIHIGIKGKTYSGLHKRPFPLDGRCEICGIELDKYGYHHWNDSNLNLGIWVCHHCDFFVEGLDEIDKNPWKVDIYRRLKGRVEEAEKTYVYLGPFLPSDGIYKLFLNNEQTHKFCSHCGQMKLVKEFYKGPSMIDGLDNWCKECTKSSQIGHRGQILYGLHKRPKPNSCEFCGSKTYMSYHHWDDNNLSKGVWICGSRSGNKCHNLAHAVDLMDSGSLLPGKYHELKGLISDG